jgi:hypothetical protein
LHYKDNNFFDNNLALKNDDNNIGIEENNSYILSVENKFENKNSNKKRKNSESENLIPIKKNKLKKIIVLIPYVYELKNKEMMNNNNEENFYLKNDNIEITKILNNETNIDSNNFIEKNKKNENYKNHKNDEDEKKDKKKEIREISLRQKKWIEMGGIRVSFQYDNSKINYSYKINNSFKCGEITDFKVENAEEINSNKKNQINNNNDDDNNNNNVNNNNNNYNNNNDNCINNNNKNKNTELNNISGDNNVEVGWLKFNPFAILNGRTETEAAYENENKNVFRCMWISKVFQK